MARRLQEKVRERKQRMRRSMGVWIVLGAVACAPANSPVAPKPLATGDGTTDPPRDVASPLAPEHVEGIDPEAARAAIQRLISDKIGPAAVEIVAATPPVGGWVAVAVHPPFREFPNVVLFRHEGGQWQRVHEGLSLGIQPYPSPFLDTHTHGLAFDATIQGRNEITDELLAAIEQSAAQSGLLAVPHAHFVHSHPAGAERYFLDRRFVLEVAHSLYPEYSRYPHDTCQMFDYAPLLDLRLEASGDGLRLTATTRTGQGWTATWSGADARGRLIGKKIAAGWLPTRKEAPPPELSKSPLFCRGTVPPALRNELAIRAAQARGCYEAELRRRSDLEGRLVVETQISPEGQLLSLFIRDPGPLAEISDCVGGSFRRPYLSGSSGECATVNVPIAFKRKNAH